MVLWIREQLNRAGYRVWVDVEEMKGSALEAMAQATEEAAAFVMVMTDAYKNSPNCRAEAEYAWTICKRNGMRDPVIIPVMAQADWNPTGWLGILLGSKLYVAGFHEGR